MDSISIHDVERIEIKDWKELQSDDGTFFSTKSYIFHKHNKTKFEVTIFD